MRHTGLIVAAEYLRQWDFPVVVSPEEILTQIYTYPNRRFTQSRFVWKTWTSTVIAATHNFVRLLHTHNLQQRKLWGLKILKNYFAWQRITCSPFPTQILACFGKCIVTQTTISQSYRPHFKAKYKFPYGFIFPRQCLRYNRDMQDTLAFQKANTIFRMNLKPSTNLKLSK